MAARSHIKDQSCRNPKQIYNASIDTIIAEAPILEQLRELSPDLKIYTRSSPSFASLRAAHQLGNDRQPLAICRPMNEIEVAHIVSFCSSSGLPLAVRSGGHDGWSRSCVDGGIVIDLRELDSITLDQDMKSVKVGGGTLAINLTRFLGKYDLVATTGLCGTVGIVNWASCGGYGPFVGSFGLGVDQILGARIVNANGEIIDADKEIMWGIRGAGGNFGVIVNMTIRVHELTNMLGGIIAFPFKDARLVLERYMALLDDEFPDPWGGGVGILKAPDLGLVVIFMSTWSSPDLERGQAFMRRVRELGSPVVDTVSATLPKDFLETASATAPASGFVATRSCNVRGFSKGFIDTMIKHAEKMPSTAFFGVHNCHGRGAQPHEGASFSDIGPHLMVEIVGSALTREEWDSASAWADEAAQEIKAKKLLLDEGYVSLMAPSEPVAGCFGDSWNQLRELKKKMDSNNLFANAVPSLV